MSIIGSVVQYTDEKTASHGLVLDKVLMVENLEGQFVNVTGYLIKSIVSNKIKNIQHWRIISVLESEEEKEAKEDEDIFTSFGSGNDIFGAMQIPKNDPKKKNIFADDEDNDLPF